MIRWLIALVLACSVGCASLLIVPTNEDPTTWAEFRTSAGDRTIVYKLPPDPQIRIRPRRLASLNGTSFVSEAIVDFEYGYGMPEPRIAELEVVLQIKPVDGGGMEPQWDAEQFAQFYWRRMQSCRQNLSPDYPKLEKKIQSAMPELGETTWYQLTYPDLIHGGRISGDIFLRPISATHVLAVNGLYIDYELMSPEAIERRRALMRKIVAQVRVEPPFGSVRAPVPP